MQTQVIVIGGGQAGLAMGYHLARRGIEFVILDAAPRVGDAWRGRWDSLRLFTPARYSGLPGMTFPGDPDRYPGKDDVADYLEVYAAHFDLPVRAGQRVRAVRPGRGGWTAETVDGQYDAAQVVVATGPFQRPAVPALGSELPSGVVQIHSASYQNPARLPASDVLVVGAGNSGVQIAEELSQTHRVHLAVGERMPRLPQRVLGRSLFWWLEKTGVMDVSVDSRLGRRMSRTDTLIGKSPRMLRGVELHGRAVEVRGDTVLMADGAGVNPASVVWATGFRTDFGWIEAPVLGPHGLPVHRRGVTAAPGLYFLGLSWLHTRGSALIGWVGRDAEHLAATIEAQAPEPIPGAVERATA
ncbi:MAG TPA: NAD(P)/FAD-dependent oxidoreductase [Longimicrobium sp.]|nr:NAD(P)/FAD-dependent oxidoreductase [Longimicrobium sp.]